MVPNFGLLTIHRVCVHMVHKKETGQPHSVVEYDETIITLDQDVHDIITKRLRTYCGERSRSFELIIEKGLDLSFYGHAHTLRQSADPEFVEKTKAIALLLGQSQTSARPPASCLVVLDAVAEGGIPVVVCIKAELTEALTQEITNGVSTLKKVEKLFMGRQEKFFKLGIIYKLTNAEILELEANQEEPLLPQQEWGAILYDHQFRSNTRPAEYFWKDFLGFSIASNEKIKLKQLYDSTVAFIDDKITDVETRSQMMTRLDDYITNANVEQVDPSFIMENIVPEDKRDAFDATVREEFPRPFMKDTSLVAKKIAKSRMEFPSKLVLSGSRQAFTAVQVIESQAELDRLRFEPGFTIIRIEGNPDRIPNLRYVE
jgi:hypothetical protein